MIADARRAEAFADQDILGEHNISWDANASALPSDPVANGRSPVADGRWSVVGGRSIRWPHPPIR
jgi:hypothetical protein